MSELKVHKAYNRWIDEEMPTPNDDLICNEVYLKSEADKVINHYKYKRCLDKAHYWVAVIYQCVDDKHKQRAEKRHYKWLKLAEQFKGAK